MFRFKNVFMEEAGAEDAAAGSAPPTTTPAVEEAPAPSVPPDANWRSTLPPELAQLPSLQDIPDVATLAKNYDNTKAMVGSSIRLPTNEAGQEAIDAVVQKVLENGNLPLMRRPDPENSEAMTEVYKALGRPEDASGYAAPEGVDSEAFGSMADAALTLGLSKAQYEGIAQALATQQQAAFDAHEQNRTQGLDQLRGEWGPAFDQKAARGLQVAQALKAPGALIEALQTGTANAETLRFVDMLATQLGQEGSQLASQIGAVTEATVTDLQQRIDERTQRMITENLSQRERDRLIQANVADQERIIASRK